MANCQGDRVRIYAHPMVESGFVDTAILIKMSSPRNQAGLEYWCVQFDNQLGIVQRWVKAKSNGGSDGDK